MTESKRKDDDAGDDAAAAAAMEVQKTETRALIKANPYLPEEAVAARPNKFIAQLQRRMEDAAKETAAISIREVTSKETAERKYVCRLLKPAPYVIYDGYSTQMAPELIRDTMQPRQKFGCDLARLTALRPVADEYEEAANQRKAGVNYKLQDLEPHFEAAYLSTERYFKLPLPTNYQQEQRSVARFELYDQLFGLEDGVAADKQLEKEETAMLAAPHYRWEYFGEEFAPPTAPFATDMDIALAMMALAEKNEGRVFAPRVVSRADFTDHVKSVAIGISSSSFIKCADGMSFQLADEITVEGYLPARIKEYSEDFLECGAAFLRLQQFVQRLDKKCSAGSCILQSLHGSLLKYLDMFRVFGHSQQSDRLARLYCDMTPMMEQLRMVADLFAPQPNAELKSGLEYFSEIWSWLKHCLNDSDITLLFFLANNICTAYYELLQNWLYRGARFDPSGDELFIRYKPDLYAPNTKAYFDGAFTLCAELLPDFLAEISESLLECGRHTRLLREFRPEHMLFQLKAPTIVPALTYEELVEVERVCLAYDEEARAICGAPLTFEQIFEKRREKRMLVKTEVAKRYQQHLEAWQEECVRKQQSNREHAEELKAQMLEAIEAKKNERRERFVDELLAREELERVQAELLERENKTRAERLRTRYGVLQISDANDNHIELVDDSTDMPTSARRRTVPELSVLSRKCLDLNANPADSQSQEESTQRLTPKPKRVSFVQVNQIAQLTERARRSLEETDSSPSTTAVDGKALELSVQVARQEENPYISTTASHNCVYPLAEPRPDLCGHSTLKHKIVTRPDLVMLEHHLCRSVQWHLITHFNIVRGELMRVFLGELNVYAHFRNLRRHFFLLDGEFGLLLTNCVIAKLEDGKKPQQLLDCKKLHTRVIPSEQSEVLSFNVRDEPLVFDLISPDALKSLSLHYKVEWPLNLVLSPELMGKYGEIFNFLLKVRRIAFVLERACQHMRLAHKSHGRELRAALQFRRLEVIRHKLYNFIARLQNHLATNAIEAPWQSFKLALIGVDTIDELHSAHADYIELVYGQCLLSRDNAPVYDALDKIFTISLFFCKLLTASSFTAVTGIDGGHIEFQHERYTALLEQESRFDHFMRYMITQWGSRPDLSAFLAWANFNGCYIKNADSA